MSIFNMMTSGGGSFEHETGTFTLTNTVYSGYTVNFSKTHSRPPTILMAFYSSDNTGATGSQQVAFVVIDVSNILGHLWTPNSGYPLNFGILFSEKANGTGSTNNSVILSTRSEAGVPTATYDARTYLREDSATIKYSTLYANQPMTWLAIWLPDGWTPPTA